MDFQIDDLVTVDGNEALIVDIDGSGGALLFIVPTSTFGLVAVDRLTLVSRLDESGNNIVS